jgi:hypothetical protein
MNYHTLNQELGPRIIEIERLCDKLAADLAQTSFYATELEFDIQFADRSYLEDSEEIIETA